MRAAAIQMKATLGAVEENCASAERLALEAIGKGAELVILPEFFTSAVAFHPSLLDAARPVDGEPFQLLVRLAKEHGVILGGSFIASRAEGDFNTFVLAFPDGSTFLHDKDLPTMWENCYYEPGSDDGVLDTPAGPIGAAVCWELVRTQTVRRLKGKVGLVVGGSCWWDMPYGEDTAEARTGVGKNVALYEKTPPTVARLLRVPLVHAAHTGDFEGLTPGAEGRPYKSRFLGRAQIVDGHGKILAVAEQDEGDAVVVADITPGLVDAEDLPIPDGFWIHEMTEASLSAWESQNAFGQQYFAEVTKPHRGAQG